ncbi:MAG TPA: acyltransferase [Novosphingobium sp.]|nr:acyltransferase [Novosphingobium sp.]
MSCEKSSQPSDTSFFRYFDLMRFVAAGLVMFSHARDLLLVDYAQANSHSAAIKLLYAITGLGHEAVVIFFVLSGFWIASSIDRRKEAPYPWRNYAIDRLARLYIVLLPALALTCLCDSLGIYLQHSALYEGHMGPHSVTTRIADQLDIGTLLGNLAFLQTLFVKTYGSNGPLWSLANEFWYYLAYPGLFLLVWRRQPSVWLLACPLVLYFPALRSGMVVWLAGAGLYYITRGRPVSPPRSGLLSGGLIGLAVLALIGSLALSRSAKLDYGMADLAIGGSFTLLLWLLMQFRPRFARPLAPLADFGAQASFSLYLCHFPLIALLSTMLTGAGRLQPDGRGLALLIGLGIVATLYSLLFAWCTERHTTTLRRWLKQRFIPALHAPVDRAPAM